jgi:multicomponent K+:H+ antiporter subunit D
MPVAALLLVCVVMAVQAEPLMRYTLATAQSLHAPSHYIDAVHDAAPVPARPTGGAR